MCLGSAEEPTEGALPWIIWFSIPVTRVMDFAFESAEFPQGNVMAALGWVERRGVAHLVRSVCQTGAVAVLRSRRLWSTREEAERELARFLDVVALRREAGGLAPCCCLS